MIDRDNARYLRIAVVRNVLEQGGITRDEALELLKGRLSPDDPDSVVDDTNLIDLPVDEITKILVPEYWERKQRLLRSINGNQDLTS